ncbi:hypothetical protein [Psychroserpens ponticola]|uniref:TonB-dependent receptor plug domain-containing protein n=1 Tax=Psychroserpens ponticola TaxID=2932268 RepID=A0ABY7RYP2_9FLAO|nr:hypothetical protein [Psychroserpens ponticola]WCO02260.1 hypothetical protein MUN68_001930 [Psychroserpens ponticola]
MKKQHLVLFVLLSFLVNLTNAQVERKNQLEDTYASYYSIERETIHLHLNKNVFILEEPVWFKAYIYNKDTNKPAINSTNIFVSLYDEKGKEIDKKLFFAQNGVVSGTMELSSAVTPGNYYLRAYTNWMNNFPEDESFTSLPIHVVNPYKEELEAFQDEETATPHDVQFLPEGGYAIENSNNTIGVKVSNLNQNESKIKGSIFDNNTTEVLTFETNSFGHGKFNLIYEKDKTYYAVYTINNKEEKTFLPKPKPTGFNITIDNYSNEKYTYINLKTNANTLELNKGKTYYLVINQNSKISVVNLDLNNLKTQNTIPVESANLVPGVNTIALFDDNSNPILERLIFNYQNINVASVNTNIKKVKDSITVNLKVNTQNNQNQLSQLSVSTLPNINITNASNADIMSSFLIHPYIKGQVQNASHYFKNVDRLKKYDLDLLLLTQGWSKYEWKNIKKGQLPVTYGFEVGLKIEGTFNRYAKKHRSNKTQMFSMTNGVNENTTIDQNTNTFVFDNYFLKDGAVINFSLYENDKAVPKVNPVIQTINGKRELMHAFKSKTKVIRKKSTQSDLRTAFKAYNIEKLDTVNLSYKKKKVVEKPLKHEKSYIANKYSNGIKIDSMIERTYFNISDLINANGFVVEDLAGTGFTRIKNRNPVTYLGSNEPILIIDNVNLGNNYDMLFNLTFEDIDEIYINTNGLGYGAAAAAGVIRIYRKDGSQSLEKIKLREYGDVVIKNGFSIEKKFYTPAYYFKSDDVLSEFACLDWASNITTNDLGMYTYKMKDSGLNDLVLVIQGFTSTGELISEIKTVKVDKNQ